MQIPPKYQCIRDEIILDFYRDNYKTGDFYGTEASLCRKFNASRNTIRHALKELTLTGYISRRQKQGIRFTFSRKENLRKRLVSPMKMSLMLPQWNFVAGNPYIQEMNRIANRQNFQLQVLLEKDLPGLLEKPPDVLICIDPSADSAVITKKLAERNCRIIVTVPQMPLSWAVNVISKSEIFAYESVRFLVEHGHRRIGLMVSFEGHPVYIRWVNGFIHAMAEFELPIQPGAVCDQHLFAAYKKELLGQLTGFICTNRTYAIQLSRECHLARLKIPEDISVIGTNKTLTKNLPHFNIPLSIIQPDRQFTCIEQILTAPEAYPPGTICKSHAVPMILNHGSVTRCGRG